MPPGLAGSHHIGKERIERVRTLGHRLGERRPGLDVEARLVDGLGQPLVRLFLGQQFQALHEWKTGINHDGELPGEDRQAPGR